MSQTDPNNVEQRPSYQEELQVMGEQLVSKVKELIHEGNVRHLILKHDGHILLEIPVTAGVAVALLAPTLAAIAALGAAMTHCTVEVVRTEGTA